jgi:hypothetical protein
VEVRGTSRRATAPAEEGGGRGHGGAGGVRKQWRRGLERDSKRNEFLVMHSW